MVVNIWIEKWKYLDSWIGYTTGYVTHNVFFALVRFYLWAYFFFFESNGLFKHNFILFFVCRNVHFVYLTFCGYFTYIRELLPQMNICSLQLKKAMKKVYSLS